MTARSDDALSHVIFQPPQNAVLTEIGAPNLTLGPDRDPALRLRRIGSCRICMAAMRRHRGTNPANPLHLPFTCLNRFAPDENSIRK